MVIVVGIPQTVFDNAIGYLSMTQSESCPGLIKIIRNVAHAFHTSRNHYIVIAIGDRLRSQHYRFHTACTYFVYSGARKSNRQACIDAGLLRWRLADTRAHHIAHKKFINLVRLYAASFEGCPDGDGAEVWCGNRSKRSVETADRCAGNGEDVYV